MNEALNQVRQGMEIAPMSPLFRATYARALYMSRQYERARQEYRAALDSDPNSADAHADLGFAEPQAKDFSGAMAEFRKAVGLTSDDPKILAGLGYVYAVAGKKGETLNILTRLDTLSKRRLVSSYSRAAIYAGLGKKQEALRWLEQAYRNHEKLMLDLKCDPAFDTLRSLPEFQELTHRIGLA